MHVYTHVLPYILLLVRMCSRPHIVLHAHSKAHSHLYLCHSIPFRSLGPKWGAFWSPKGEEAFPLPEMEKKRGIARERKSFFRYWETDCQMALTALLKASGKAVSKRKVRGTGGGGWKRGGGRARKEGRRRLTETLFSSGPGKSLIIIIIAVVIYLENWNPMHTVLFFWEK